MEVFMATIKEIAEIVGVSSAAVSRVLNYDEGISVSAETRAAIFAEGGGFPDPPRPHT